MRLLNQTWHVEVFEKGDTAFWQCGSSFDERDTARWHLNDLKARKENRKGTKFSLVRRETLEHVEFTDVK